MWKQFAAHLLPLLAKQVAERIAALVREYFDGN